MNPERHARIERLARLGADGLTLALAAASTLVAIWAIGTALMSAWMLADLLVRIPFPGLPRVPPVVMTVTWWLSIVGFGPFVAGASLRLFFPGARTRALPWQRVVLVCAHEAAATAVRDELRVHGLHAGLVGWQPSSQVPGRVAVAVPRSEYGRACAIVRPRLATT
jgi:hypothetical protein